jgi:hypothetical protein
MPGFCRLESGLICQLGLSQSLPHRNIPPERFDFKKIFAELHRQPGERRLSSESGSPVFDDPTPSYFEPVLWDNKFDNRYKASCSPDVLRGPTLMGSVASAYLTRGYGGWKRLPYNQEAAGFTPLLPSPKTSFIILIMRCCLPRQAQCYPHIPSWGNPVYCSFVFDHIQASHLNINRNIQGSMNRPIEDRLS